MKNYSYFELYEVPKKPNERGNYYGKTPILNQALDVIENAKKHGKTLFIKGVTADGQKVLFI